ncbi:MAG: PilZ domain [Acidobacteriota bacterium]|nr:PilZ domain [Acidobacteriota bacterium]
MERRQANRVEVNLDAYWEGLLAQCSGLVVDLSGTGCFILTSDRVVPNELVRLTLNPSSSDCVHVWGQVVYQVSEMGFALRFLTRGEGEGESNSEHAALWQLLAQLDGAPEAQACA